MTCSAASGECSIGTDAASSTAALLPTMALEVLLSGAVPAQLAVAAAVGCCT